MRLLPAFLVLTLVPVVSAQPHRPPDTRRDTTIDIVHGVRIPDPYRWLEQQDAPETRAWIDAQNAYTREMLKKAPAREPIVKRLTGLMKIDSIGVPIARGGRYFLTRRAADQDLPVLCMRRTLDGPDEVLVDPQAMSADRTVSVNFEDISTDGMLVAYGVRQGGQDEVEVSLLDVETKRPRPAGLPKGRYFGINLSADKRLIYYAKQLEAGPRVFVHTIGGDPTTDREIFGAGYGPGKIIGAGTSDDARWLVLTVLEGSASNRTEIHVKDLSRDDSPIVPIVNDIAADFSPTIGGDTVYLRTNWEAPTGRVFAVPLAHPARDAWREIVPAGKGTIEDVAAVGGRLFITVLENVVPRIRMHDARGTLQQEVALPGPGTVSGVTGPWSSQEAFYIFQSFAQPPTVYRVDTTSGSARVWAQPKVPIDPSAIEVKQVSYASKDGTRIPMFVAHRKGLALDGSAPALLTGYGGFNVSNLPTFSAKAAAWIQLGGVWALASLRGGGEFGEPWHQAGMLGHKQQVFDDFIAAAEYLVANKYTTSARLAVSGGSNGGLLVGALFTQRPELARAVICSVPLLDMIRYQNFLVARYWVPEYGSSDDPEQFKWLLAYSPYHNVKPGTKYPAIFFITGDGDTRVASLHARKMTALMQSASSSGLPVLLRYDTKAGHSAGMPVTKLVEDLADEFQFLLSQVGGERTQ